MMTKQKLVFEAEQLEQQLTSAGAGPKLRLELQPQFSKVIARLKDEGLPVPHRMLRLDAALTQEAVEAQFDNMPV